MKTALVLSAVCLTAGLAHADLLLNGNFNTDTDNNGPDGWSLWTYGSGGFAAYKNPADSFAYDASPYINAGNWADWWSSGGGWNQIVAAAPGISYTLTGMSATEGWDNAAGEMRLIFLDASQTVLRQDVANTANYQANLPWQQYSMTSLAPDGTAYVKAEFATWGARGAVMWDNASLIVAVPEPTAISLTLGGAALLLAARRRR